MSRPTLKAFKKEALKKKGVKDQYEDLTPAYEIRKEFLKSAAEETFKKDKRVNIQISSRVLESIQR